MPILFVLFIVVPLVELYFLFQVSDVIGGWETILLVIITAFLGSYFIRQQGVSTILKAQQNMQQGQLPAMELVEGLILVIAGVMLVTPGFITDSFGFLLLIPPLRQSMIASVGEKMAMRQNHQQQSPFGGFHQQQGFHSRPSANQDDVIEGEYTKEDK
jgi:UPF0716 protein FxsA